MVLNDMSYDSVKSLFEKRGILKCSEIVTGLESLGFTVKEGKSPNHKIFEHDELPEFTTGSFNCGHGKNGEVKSPYIRKILKALRDYEEELKALQGE